MQFGRLALIIIILFILIPIQPVSAENMHFNPEAVANGFDFESSDGSFKLTVSPGEYQEPMDVYLYRLPSSKIAGELNSLTEIYSYYVYANEVSDQSEFGLTISYDNDDHASGKTVYFLNSLTKKWELASSRAFSNNLTFKLKGKKNQLVVVGTHLVQTSALNQGRQKVSETFNFNLDPNLSQLEYNKVCRTYLTDYFKSNKTNSDEEVKKLQTFLREDEGFSDLPATGYYGNLTYAAVKAFQERYAADILLPWGITTGTGWVLGTTLDKINEVYCQKNPDSYSYEFSIPYDQGSKQAKTAYWLNGSTWEKLESFDDSRNQTVTAVTSQASAQVALFEENDQWAGEASWYAWKDGLYAASRDFPKGTKLRVTNQVSGENRGKSVIVEVNDYGPELGTGRFIDLDKAAFGQINDLKTGVTRVRIEAVK